MPDTELPMETVEGVEALSVGTHPASPETFKVTKAVLNALVKTYEATRDKLAIPVKLGHDRYKGEPARGWVENLRVKGSMLLVDLVDVPAKLAALVRVRAYRRPSVEVGFNFDVAGTKYQYALTGLALLGAEIPADKNIGDIAALYGDRQVARAFEDAENVVVITMAEALDFSDLMQPFDEFERRVAPHIKGRLGVRELRALLATAKRGLRGILEKHGRREADAAHFVAVPRHNPPIEVDAEWDGPAATEELRIWASADGSGDPDTIDFDKYAQGFAVVEGAADNFASYKFAHHRIIDGELKTSTAGVTAAASAASDNADAIQHLTPHREAISNLESEMDVKEMATVAGLDPETATEEEVTAAIKAKFEAEPAAPAEPAEPPADPPADPPAEPGPVEAAHAVAAEAQTKVLALEAKMSRREEEDAVETAIEARKFLPKQREKLLTLCADVGVEKFVELADSQVEQVDTRELGHAGSESDLAAYAPTREQMTAAASMYPLGIPASHIKALTCANAEAAGVTITTNTEG